MYSSTKILIKIPVTFFTELEKKNLKVHIASQKTDNSQADETGGNTAPDFKACCADDTKTA